MAASLSPAQTLPEELLRQSERIQEQLLCLNRILDTSTSHLGNMVNILTPYSSQELVNEVNKLRNTLGAYKSKAGNIYNEVSEGLKTYALDLINNLTELQESIETISQAVESL